jgi:hypothetical protein
VKRLTEELSVLEAAHQLEVDKYEAFANAQELELENRMKKKIESLCIESTSVRVRQCSLW